MKDEEWAEIAKTHLRNRDRLLAELLCALRYMIRGHWLDGAAEQSVDKLKRMVEQIEHYDEHYDRMVQQASRPNRFDGQLVLWDGLGQGHVVDVTVKAGWTGDGALVLRRAEALDLQQEPSDDR